MQRGWATFRTDKGRPDIAFSGQYSIRPWNIANIGRLNNGSNVTLDFNYTYTIYYCLNMNTFHKILSVLAILIANCISASAIEFTVDGVRYSVNDGNKTVTVAGYPSGSKPTGHLTIPESVTYGGISYPVTSIGGDAFRGCSGLTSVTIGNSVTYIGYEAFYGCSGLTSVTIGNSVTSIGNFAFYKCSGLASAIIPNSVTSIGGDAFRECTGLTSVTIPNSVTSIGDWAFYDCSGLTSITIPNSVISIGYEAFRYCSGLTSVTIGKSVTSIGLWAFDACSGLTSIKVESGNSVYDSRENCNAIIETATNTLIRGCNNTIIPNSVTSIGDKAFYGSSGLTSVTIPNSVISIGNQAFIGCSGLTSVAIPNSVTSIGNGAFSFCSGLTSVTIPNSVTKIGNDAFYYCSGLTKIDAYPNPEKVSTGWDAFYGVPENGTLHVLPKYLSAYLTASEWRDFTHIKDDLTEIGDINLDGKVDVSDVTTLVNMIANGETANLELADINADGKVNVSDVTALVNIILK